MPDPPTHPVSHLYTSQTVGDSLRVYLPVTALSRTISLIRGPALAWLMTRADWGLVSVALLVVNILHPISSLGLNDAVQRYVPQHETRGTLRPFLRLAVPLTLVLGAMVSALLLILAAPLGKLLFSVLGEDQASAATRVTVGLTRTSTLAALALVLFYLLSAILRGLRMYRAFGLIELAGNALFAIWAVLMCLAGWRTPAVVLGTYTLSLMFIAGLGAWPLRGVLRRLEPLPAAAGHRPDIPAAPESDSRWPFRASDSIRRLLSFGLWASLAAVLWQVLLGYPLLHLQKVAGPDVAALFVASGLIAQGMVVVASSIVTVIESAVTRSWEAVGRREADRQLSLAYKSTIVLLLCGGTAVALLAPVVMRLFPRSYADGARVLPLLILFYLLASHLLFVGVHFRLIERTRHLFVPWLLGVIGHYFFAARWIRPDAHAAMSAAWAGIAGLTVALIVALLIAVLERRPLDRGGRILILAGYLLALPTPWAWLLMILLVLSLAMFTGILISPADRSYLRDRLRQLTPWTRLPS